MAGLWPGRRERRPPDHAPDSRLRWNRSGVGPSGRSQPYLGPARCRDRAVSDGYFLGLDGSEQSLVNLVGRRSTRNEPAGDALMIYDADAATVTPREPELVAGPPGVVIVAWTAGPAAHSRIFSRRIQLPATPLGDTILVDDPPDPVSGVLIPRSVTFSGGRHRSGAFSGGTTAKAGIWSLHFESTSSGDQWKEISSPSTWSKEPRARSCRPPRSIQTAMASSHGRISRPAA